MKNLANLTSIIFFISILIGIIGIIFKCKYIESDYNTFYFQKFIQNFLICQYLNFWTIYNFSPPNSLNSFFLQFFKICISWHKIFKNKTKNNFSGKNFSENFFYEEKMRFFINDIYTHFITNFSFIILLHFIFFFFI